MTNRSLLVALATLLVLPACTALQPSSALAPAALLSDAPARPLDRECHVSAYPETLPAADALVDSAALAEAVARAWRAAGAPAGHVLLALRYDPDGVNVRRDVIEHRLGTALADTLQQLVFAHRRRVDATDREWSVRLRLDLGDTPRMRVGRAEVCSPRMRNGNDAGWGRVASTWGDMRDPFTPASMADAGSSTVWVRVALDARGNVTDARLERSIVRPVSANRLLSWVRTIAFVPAMEDGYPVPGQLSMPLRMDR